MKISKTTDKNSKKIILVTYDDEKWKNLIKKTHKEETERFNKLDDKVKKQQNLKEVPKDFILKLSANYAIREMTNDEKVKEEIKPGPEEDSTVEILEATDKILNVQFSFFDKPKVDLAFIDDIKIEVPKKPRINENEINRYIQDILKSRADKTEVTRPSKDGDVVNIDFEGFIDNKPFENSTVKNYNLELGSKRFVPGFEEQLLNFKVGDHVDVKIKFPDTYSVKTLAGKVAIFKVKINKVLELKLPEMSNDFVKSLKIPKVEDVGGFKSYCKSSIMRQVISRYQQTITNSVVVQLLQRSGINIPSKLLNLEVKITKELFSEQATRMGVTETEFARRNGLDPQKYSLQLEAIAINKIKLSYILREYVTKHKINVTEKEFQEAYEVYKTSRNPDSPEPVISFQDFTSKYINDIALNKISETIVNNSDVGMVS